MNVETRWIRTRPAALSVLIAVLLGLAACGGSGSSGFDISPLTEAQAIARAIDTGDCVTFGSHTFCASGAEVPSGDFKGSSVIIDAPNDPLVCDGHPAIDQCTAPLMFTTKDSFNAPTELTAAVAESERGPWTLAPVSVTDDLTTPRNVSIAVPGRRNAANPTPLIAAVLVYAGPPPDALPPTAAHLADFGADLVYVSPRLEIVVPR